MRIKIIAPKATRRQKKQLEKWLWEKIHFATMQGETGLIDLKDLPVMIRRVVAVGLRGKNLVDTMIKKKLIEKLLPLVKEQTNMGCYGATVIGSLELDKPSVVICQCSGEDQQEHMRKQKRKLEISAEICKIIEEEIGEPVFRYPGTYGDVHICRIKDSGLVLSIDINGEIKERRAYA